MKKIIKRILIVIFTLLIGFGTYFLFTFQGRLILDMWMNGINNR